jgi:hypothetical protein
LLFVAVRCCSDSGSGPKPKSKFSTDQKNGLDGAKDWVLESLIEEPANRGKAGGVDPGGAHCGTAPGLRSTVIQRPNLSTWSQQVGLPVAASRSWSDSQTLEALEMAVAAVLIEVV